MTSEARVVDAHIGVGMSLGWREHTVTPEMVQSFADSVGDHNPWYFGPSPFGGPVVPSLFFHSEPFRHQGWFLSHRHGTLFAKQEWDFFHPVMVGDRVRTYSIVIDRYIRRNREYVGNELLIFSDDYRLLARARTYQSFLADPTYTGAVIDKEREKAPERRLEITTEGALGELKPVRKQVTPEMCMIFSGPMKNYHNDVEEARKMGFPDIVVAGPMSICFLGQMLTENFGEGWFRGGRLSVNLINILWGSDAVTARGLIRSELQEGPGLRVQADIWCEKDDGTKTIIGTASGVRPAI
jgi:acyl dehydratase